MTSQVKISSFYGSNVARPFLVFDSNGKEQTERVNKPDSVNAPILKWTANRAHSRLDRSLQKQDPYHDKIPKARHEFTIFCDTQRADILASNPFLLSDPDNKTFKVAASLYWKETLKEFEREKYRQMAAEELCAQREAVKQLKDQDPDFQSYLEKEALYKKFNIADPKIALLRTENKEVNIRDKLTPSYSRKIPQGLKLTTEQQRGRATKRYTFRSKANKDKGAGVKPVKSALTKDNTRIIPRGVVLNNGKSGDDFANHAANANSDKAKRGSQKDYSDKFALPELDSQQENGIY